jgi:hypothetical protein
MHKLFVAGDQTNNNESINIMLSFIFGTEINISPQFFNL